MTKRFLLISLLLLAGFVMGRYSSALLHKSEDLVKCFKLKLQYTFTTSPSIPIINITLSKDALEKLDVQKKEALKREVLLKNADDYVNASISFKNQTSTIKLRLKGDWADHLNTNKWSMRIKSDVPILGMKKFSLQNPSTRNYLSEWVFYRALHHEGLIALQYFFVKVVINNEDHGIYAMEEFFDDHFFTRNHLPLSPIIKFNEDNTWKELVQYIDAGINKNEMYDHLCFQTVNTALIDAFDMKNLLKDSIASKQFSCAKNLLYGFLDSLLPASKVFDNEKMPKFVALCEAMGAEHALLWHNLRFYYNSNTKLLEPIGYDAELDSCPAKNNGYYFRSTYHTDIFLRLLLNDSVFTAQYIYWLNYYSQPEFLNQLQNELKDSIQKNLDVLHTEWSEIDLPNTIWEKDRKLIQLALSPIVPFYAYLKDTINQKINIEIDNITGLPIEIIGLEINDSTLIYPTNKHILLRYPQRNTICFQGNFQTFKLSNFQLKYRILGLSKIKTEKVIPYARR